MRKVGGLILLLILLFTLPVIAQEQANSDDAYTCLRSEIANKSSESFSLQEAIFSTLALGSQSEMTDKIENEMSNSNCWPKSSCTIKETSQVLLAYDRINKNTEDIESYLLSKNQTASELTWYLQTDIEQHIPSTCTFSYDDRDYDVSIGEDMKISGGAGPCLTLSSSEYWLQVSRNCQENEYRISCDQSFITSLLYQKANSDTIYISSSTHAAASSGTTQEQINSQCFTTSSGCDYEGSLWATMALQKAGETIDSFLPYLLAFAEDNQKFFPASFLYLLTSSDDQYSEISQKQKQDGFWEAPGTAYNKFYDTSLGMLSLQGQSAEELGIAQDYLLTIQTPEGCWNNNNIRDTAFLLYSGWPDTVSGTDGNGGGPNLDCVEQGKYCGGTFECSDAGGEIINNLECPGLQYCCSAPLIQETCAEQNGVVCSFGQECSGTTVQSQDGSCCIATCQEVSQQTQCGEYGGSCLSSCGSDYEESTQSCDDPGLVCCFSKDDSSSGSSLWIWIIILIILIALVVLGIIYKDKIKMWWRKFRSKKKPSARPGPGGPRPPPRRAIRRPSGAPIRRPSMLRRPMRSHPKDKEMDETLRKLKEMSR